MSDSHTRKQLVILETFSQAVQEAKTADEVAEILLNCLFEAFPGFDEGYVLLPDGKGSFRPVVQRMGLEVSYPSKKIECLAETVAEADGPDRVERLPDGSLISLKGGDEEGGIGILGVSATLGVSSTLPGRSRLCVPLGEAGAVHGYLEFRSRIDHFRDLEYLAGEMREFLDIGASALTRIGEGA